MTLKSHMRIINVAYYTWSCAFAKGQRYPKEKSANSLWPISQESIKIYTWERNVKTSTVHTITSIVHTSLPYSLYALNKNAIIIKIKKKKKKNYIRFWKKRFFFIIFKSNFFFIFIVSNNFFFFFFFF